MNRSRNKKRFASRSAGFTLLELLIVILIIGIILTFILVVANDGVKAAQVRQTQALIAKLESALNDRLEAMLATPVPVTASERYLAAIGLSGGGALAGSQRSRVIAEFDYLKSEFPDVFYVQYPSVQAYPLNFAAIPFTGTPMGVSPYDNYVLPIGHAVQNNPSAGSYGSSNVLDKRVVIGGTGIFGASYAVASGIYQQLGYAPQGYDGVDNNGDGLVDDLTEGTSTLNAGQIQTLQNNLAAHKHKTARAEMLYAILVSGRSPMGSPFRADDFILGRDVADTDGDGLLEFIDAWGEPLQFYRWPIHFRSDLQKGPDPYNGSLEPRQQNSLDTGNQLVAPAWFAQFSNGSAAPSGNALVFQQFFTSLIDPNYGNVPPGATWDRGGYYPRRAFFSRFLIVSSGPDQLSGIARLGAVGNPHFDLEDYDGNGVPDMPMLNPPALSLILIENEATNQPTRVAGPFGLYQSYGPTTPASQAFLLQQGGDDIANQTFHTPGGLP